MIDSPHPASTPATVAPIASASPGAAQSAAFDERVRAEQERLKELAKSLTAAARALAPLGKPKPYEDLEKLRAILRKAQPKLEGARQADAGVARLLDELRAWVDGAGARLRQELGRELKSRCDAAGIPMKVVAREPEIELRLPPLSVVIDIGKAAAELRFARLPVERCPAEARAVVAAHAKAVQRLASGFDPAAFFDRCLRAWRAARAASGDGERVEILDFLPYLAVQMQTRKFREEPTGKAFKDYGRARFAYDVLQLRRARMLSRQGWRLNLGVATGTSASQKSRVIYFEDEHGDGEYKLTIYFTREERSEP